MSSCYIHNEQQSVGTCVGCGKFICENCNTELKGKNYCKKCVDELFDESKKKIEKLEDNNKSSQPMVFMNAGGASSSSSSSSSSSAASGYDDGYMRGLSKSKTTAGVLGILLGGLGAHKFYLGRWGWGIIYLLFCWTYIPAIIGFIEGIMYLISNPNDFARKHDPAYR